jgi:hypothetical protein
VENKIKLLHLGILFFATSLVCTAQQFVFPLKKSADQRYLVDQNNKPFPILGRTAWFVTSLSASDYHIFIDNTLSHGYNSIEFHVINHDPRGNHPPFNGNGDMPFLKRLDGSDWKGSLVYTDTLAEAPDLTTPNEAYWKYVDTFLNYCESRGLMVFMFPAYVGYANSNQGWMPELVANGAKRSQAYGNWIATRYKNQKNIVWMLLGDMGNFTAAQKEAEGALIKGLKSVEGQSTEYSAESGPGQSSADQEDFGDEMTLNGAYTWGEKGTTDVPTIARIAYSHSPVMPAFLLEEPYDEEGPDGNNVNPNAIQPVRRFQWWGWLGTIGGYIAGNGYIWPFRSPDWKKHMNTQGAFDLERLNKFIKSITWWKLVPSGLDNMKTLITVGANMSTDSDYVAAAATHDGTLLVAYVPPSHKGSITVDMTAMAGGATARWFDPTSGVFIKISGSPFVNKGTHKFTPPGKNHVGQSDWVLLLESFEGLGKKNSAMQMPINGPLRASKNPNYFQDAKGKTLILCGSHSWNTLQDWGTNGFVQKLDFDAFVRFLKKHDHNFTLIWSTELPKFHGFPTTETSSPPDITVTPFPWLRTGPGSATDGGLKFDLTKFNQDYFDRLRERVQALGNAGIYAGVYLFSGEWLLRFRNATDGYPFSGDNNVNGIDDGYRGGSVESAVAATTMNTTNAITEFQDVYVKKLINTLNDLPNVLWIVSQEASENSTWWNDRLISFVRSYEKGKPYQHPIGFGGLDNTLGDRDIYNTDADWVAPWGRISPSRSCGTGKPPCKVNINDSDHSYWEIWKETPQKNRNYVWQNFTNGNQVAFMDPYVVSYTRQARNMVSAPINGIGNAPDSRWDNFRDNLGYILKYSRKMNLDKVLPQQVLSSTGYCIAQTPATGAEYLIYASLGGPFTVDLSAMSNKRKLSVEWFNPATGKTMSSNPINAGSTSQSFNPPFDGDAVLYLVDTEGHN